MYNMRYWWLTILLITTSVGFGQSPFFQNGSLSSYRLERIEVESGILKNGFFADIGPYYRSDAAALFSKLEKKGISENAAWSTYLINENWNWFDSIPEDSKRRIFKQFYRDKANFYYVDEGDFQAFVNPVWHYNTGFETPAYSGARLFKNERGLELRANILKKLSFYSYITDNQSRYPGYVNRYIDSNGVIPGEGFWKNFRANGVDHYTARGHVSFQAFKYLNISFGHNRNFIGNGLRSLLLSDFAKDYLNLRINTKIWRFNYQNLFGELTNMAPFVKKGFSKPSLGVYQKKYMASHYLSFDLLKNLNVGFFETIIYGDIDSTGRGFEWNYANPVIFYRAIEHSTGSSDNILIGLNLHYLPFKNVSLYGQLAFDELRFFQLFDGSQWWGNKFAYQLGLFNTNFLGIEDLDLRLEYNRIRPYTYAHESSISNYVHYNQALAHPLGANLNEGILSLAYQPSPKIQLKASFLNVNQGVDTAFTNYGGNPLRNYVANRPGDNGIAQNQGVANHIQRMDFTMSYMLRHNMFIDVVFTSRLQTIEGEGDSEIYGRIGLRWNAIPKNHYF